MTKTLSQDDFKGAPEWVRSAVVDEVELISMILLKMLILWFLTILLKTPIKAD